MKASHLDWCEVRMWFTSSRDAVPGHRAHRGHARRDAPADRPRRPRPDRRAAATARRRWPRSPPGRRRDRHRVPPLPVEGRPLRRGVPARVAARGRRHARRGRRRRPRRGRRGSPRRWRPSRAARSPAGASRGRCWPSPSTPPWRPSASRSAAPTPTASPRSCADGIAARRAARPERRGRRRGARRRARRGARRPPVPRRRRHRRRRPRGRPGRLLPAFSPRSESDVRHPRGPQPVRRRSPGATSTPTTPRCGRRRARGRRWAEERLQAAGAFWGGEPLRWGAQANENPPVLHTHDRFGNRRDEVEFHPAWHQLMRARRRARAARAAVAHRPRRARTSRARRASSARRRPRPASAARSR